MMPDSFRAASDKKRLAKRARYLQLAEEAASCAAEHWPAEFERGGADFDLAAATATALDTRCECTCANLQSVRFRPFEGGVWRIEVSFANGGPWAGAEWRVSAEQLWAAWGAAVRGESTR